MTNSIADPRKRVTNVEAVVMTTTCESVPDLVEPGSPGGVPRRQRGWYIASVVALGVLAAGSLLFLTDRDEGRSGTNEASGDVSLGGVVVQVGSEILPIVRMGEDATVGVGNRPGLSLQMAPSSFSGVEPPRVIPVESVGAVVYAAVEDPLPIDRNHGIEEGASFGAPVVRSVDLATSSEELVARGVLTFAVRDDGAIAMAVGRTPNVINGEPYVRDIVVRMPSGKEATWSPRPGDWEVLAWASENLVARELVAEEGGGHQSLYLLNGERAVALPGEYLVAVSPDASRIVVSRGGQLAELPGDEPVVFLVDVDTSTTVGVLTAADIRAAGVRNLNPGRLVIRT